MIPLLLSLLIGFPALHPAPEPPPSEAVWLANGHSVVCEIAWRELTRAARAAVGALMAEDPDYDRFAPSCHWPDVVRQIAEYDRYASAHYVYVPPTADGVDVARDCGPGLCAVDAIEVFASRLRDPATTTDVRLVALKYLGHIVGDLHQPLHAGYESDRGGNLVDVCMPDGATRNLHWVWDSYLVDARLSATGLGWEEYGAFLHEDLNPVERRLWASTNPKDWADESLALVQDEVYDGVGGDCFDGNYAPSHAFTVERRLKQAGLRLGALLNDIFD